MMNYDRNYYDNLSIGEKLKKRRKNCALTQQQVADALKIERSSYTCYETGKVIPPLNTAVKLAEIFGVTLDELIFDETNSSNSRVAEPETSFYGDDTLPVINFQNLTRAERELIINFRLLKYEDMDRFLTEIIETAK